jgi:hypothetical protein
MKLKIKTEPLAVVSADLHLDDKQWGSVYGDSKFAFKQILDLTVKYRVPLILCGDVIDVKQPSVTTLTYMRNQIDRFDRKAEANQVIYYIQGQHEYSDPTWLKLLEPRYNPPYENYELLKHVASSQFTLGSFNCYAIDWTPADKLAEALSNVPKNTDYLFCHQVWDQFMGALTSPEGSLENVRVSKAVFTGDYHKHTVKYVRNCAGNKIPVYSPGATHMRAINEPSSHYAYLLHRDGSVKSIALKSRLVFRFDASTKTARLDLLANAKRYTRLWLKQAKKLDLPEELTKPLLQIKVADYNADINDAFSDNFTLFQKLTKKTTPELTKAKAVVNAGAKNCLSLVVDKSSTSYKRLSRILGTPKKDIPKVVKQIRASYIKDENSKASKH